MHNVAAIQFCSGISIKENLEQLIPLFDEAVKLGATYIQTPEMTNILQPDRPKFFETIYDEDTDPLLKEMIIRAKKANVSLHLGSLALKISEKQAVNRGFFISGAGEIKARYDKIHMFDVTLPDGTAIQESAAYRKGDKTVIVDDFAMTICYDMRFPHLYRLLAQKGATILTAPSSFTVPTGRAHWHVLLRARAIETGSFMIAAAQSGVHQSGRETYGHSLIINPWGEIMAELPEGLGVIMAEIDVTKALKQRQGIPSLINAAFNSPP